MWTYATNVVAKGYEAERGTFWRLHLTLTLSGCANISMNAAPSASRVAKYLTLGKLGLAIVRDLAEIYGGSISLEKSPTFTTIYWL